MPGRHCLALHLVGALALQMKDVEHPMKRTVLRPKDEQRALNFLVDICFVVRQVQRGVCAVVLTDCVDRVGLAERAQILREHGGADPIRQRVRQLASAEPEQKATQEYSALFWIIVSGNGDGCASKNQWVEDRGELLGDVPVEKPRGHDIEDAQLREGLRVIESQAMRNPSAPIMSDEAKRLETKCRMTSS